jgi:cytochrome c biogenesis protein CcmG, thiol:disulfide interchange protein DsbE
MHKDTPYIVYGLMLSLLLLAGCSEQLKAPANGKPAPGFTLNKMDAGRLVFPDDLQHKVVAIRFWADWCPFCKGEMTALEPVYRKYRKQGLVILAINVRQDKATVASFIDELAISYDVLLDREGLVARGYGVMGLPTTFFVDREGILKRRILGESTPETFEKILLELL